MRRRLRGLYSDAEVSFVANSIQGGTLTRSSSHTEDYFRVLVNKTGAQDMLDELEALTEKERLLTAASAYAAIREGEALCTSHSPANLCTSQFSRKSS